ncbi:hypothetical protein EG68_01940 [Paragonimus skrjabini miyazakii]|uniref:alpha-L-fucosidase n=1 Tax=Paragonimus skrjabini miyazakii TaxID=59628 RepID=A0A8S9YZV0_9TREM|nr:hypothetical protein EG68_01940 [Paragonimus skrjabini miyazakii]
MHGITDDTVCVLLWILSFCSVHSKNTFNYTPDWDSLDKRPIPQWYDEAKVGIFIHWSIFSVPSFESEWFWWLWKGDTTRRPNVPAYMREQFAPNFAYADFARGFRAEFFDPDQWAELFADAGVKYVVLTAKHHEGFCNWPSSTSWQWNSVDVGPKRDLVGDLTKSIRNRTSLRFGLYHSLFEWFNPLYLRDKSTNFTTKEYVDMKMLPELKDLVVRYQPEIIWSDGDAGPDSYWQSTEFLAWLYNESPVKQSVVTNDRWGDGCLCKHGGFFTCQDHYRPGKLIEHKWENCLTLDRKSWAFRREAILSDFLSIQELVYEVVSTVAFGGNILINVGPTAWGTISPIYEERLRQLGSWLRINGEAIYATTPWRVQNDSDHIWFTSKVHPIGFSLETLVNEDKATDRPSKTEDVPFYARLASPTTIYAIVTQWANEPLVDESIRCSTSVYLPSIRANLQRSEFYLLNGTQSTGIKLFFQPEPHGRPGVRVMLPDTPTNAVQLQWGCAIKMFNVA